MSRATCFASALVLGFCWHYALLGVGTPIWGILLLCFGMGYWLGWLYNKSIK